jgi:hypothetical protein
MRCAIHHPASGAVAYLQGNGEIGELIHALQLSLGS